MTPIDNPHVKNVDTLTQTNTAELSSILFEKGISDTSIPELIPFFRRIHLAPGSITLSPGQNWNELMVIRQGIFRLYYLDSEGKESNKGFFSEGQILAPMARSAIEKPSLFFVETLTDVDAYTCHYDQLAAILKKQPDGNHFFRRLTENLLEDKIRREMLFLQLDARGRYQQFISDFPELHERIPLRQLASYLGVTDVTLSRIRSKRHRLIKC